MTDQEIVNTTTKSQQIERLRALMHRLRAPGGCPWDAEQTHESLVHNLIEEAYEVTDAIHSKDSTHLREELGDLLLQVIFHSEIASETNTFDLDEVARGICEKLIRRHPHVFANSETKDTETVLKQWDAIKKQERGEQEKGFLHGTGKGLPALLRANKLQKKAAKVGFDWPNIHGVIEKVDEELAEVKAELHKQEQGVEVKNELRKEVGDLLFIVVNVARKLGIDPETALEGTNRKFENRFHTVEKNLLANGKDLEHSNLEEMEDLWNKSKNQHP